MRRPSERTVERTTTVVAPPSLFLIVDRGLELAGLPPEAINSVNELIILAWPLAILGLYGVMDHLGLRRTRRELEERLADGEFDKRDAAATGLSAIDEWGGER